MSYHLTLDESANEANDITLPVDGLTFVVEDRDRHLIPGLRIDVQSVYGRRGLVAYNAGGEGSGDCGC